MRDPVNAICASKRGNDCACQSRRATYHASEGGKERERWRSSLGTKSRDKRWSGGTRLAKLVAMHDFDSGSELSSPGHRQKALPLSQLRMRHQLRLRHLRQSLHPPKSRRPHRLPKSHARDRRPRRGLRMT